MSGRRRLSGPALFVLLGFVVGCAKKGVRREASSAAPRPAAVEASDIETLASRAPDGVEPVIWIGLDGVDWELMDRLSAEGRMPNWTRLVSEGYSARLRSFVPILSPIVWTTVATGLGPDLHRVLDFQEVDPATGQKVPISGRSRAVPAIWNIASAHGRTVGVVGWWATDPAEEVRGVFVSDHASPILFSALPLSGVAYPPTLDAGVRQVVARDGVVGDRELQRFIDVPLDEITRARASGAGMENRIVALARILGATRVYQRIGRDLYDRYRPDLMMVYFEGTDEIGHVFAPDSPPRMDCVSEADYARYHRAVEVYYGIIDEMLGQWMRRARHDGATLVINSDHGFKWGSDRPCERSSLNWATAAYWHRMNGVFLAWGHRVRPARERGQASVFDMDPTVSALLGLPVDRRARGRPIDAAFTALPDPPREDLSSVAVRRVPAEAMSAEKASEYTQKLIALGYLSGSEAQPLRATGGDRPGLSEGAWNNLGLYERETAGDLAAAETDFKRALALRPGYHSPMFNLAVLYRTRGERPLAQEWLFRAIAAGHPDPVGTLIRWAEEYREDGRLDAARSLLARGAKTYPDNEDIARALGLALFESHDCPGARAAVARFEATTREPETLNDLALFDVCLGKRTDALALFERSLALRPDQPRVRQSLDLLRHGIAAKGGSP
jgi:predicted AlkP superfamily phosphohydrolase/phosphomutase/Flp pilus assembly protein TadD